jgi:hypothetical protein
MGDKAGNEEWGGTYDNDAIPEIRRYVEYLPDDQPQDLRKHRIRLRSTRLDLTRRRE